MVPCFVRRSGRSTPVPAGSRKYKVGHEIVFLQSETLTLLRELAKVSKIVQRLLEETFVLEKLFQRTG